MPDQAAFAALVADLAGAPWLGEVGAILSGYFGDADAGRAGRRLVAAVKARNPAALYLCDPVIGDSDGLFQPEAIAAAIRDRLLPLADIATPNRYELAGSPAKPSTTTTRSSPRRGALGPREVVVTSAFAPPGEIGTLVVDGGRRRISPRTARSPMRRTAPATSSPRSISATGSTAQRRRRRSSAPRRRCCT